MKSILVAPASTRTAKATISALLASAAPTHAVTAVYRDLSRVPDQFRKHAAFTAVRGDVADAASLDFAGHDVVVTLSPPQPTDTINRARKIAENVASAATKAGVRRLIYISSVEAELAQGSGQIMTNRVSEQALWKAAPEVVFVRACAFMQNWGASIPTLKGAQPPFMTSTISPADFRVPMVSVEDIGLACAEQAVAAQPPSASPGAPYIFELHGPRWYAPTDVRDAFSELLGGETVELRIVEREDLEGFFGRFLAEDTARLYAEMVRSYLPGGVAENDEGVPRGVEVRKGKQTLVEALREMLAQ